MDVAERASAIVFMPTDLIALGLQGYGSRIVGSEGEEEDEWPVHEIDLEVGDALVLDGARPAVAPHSASVGTTWFIAAACVIPSARGALWRTPQEMLFAGEASKQSHEQLDVRHSRRVGCDMHREKTTPREQPGGGRECRRARLHRGGPSMSSCVRAPRTYMYVDRRRRSTIVRSRRRNGHVRDGTCKREKVASRKRSVDMWPPPPFLVVPCPRAHTHPITSVDAAT